ncbi:MAG: DegT/DnrJ/EryC1/StrS family aminotransferase, partial [Bacillota bacterium]|nr:DegT/DnrJ/EryC1/StrS family aminotransferase [Bacillota bacterium]
HKGSGLYRKYGYGEFLEKVMDCDITEIPGADNLFLTEGIIRETAEKYRALYESKKSYLLINGTSGGLIAAILASVPAGKKLIMARNCHKSVFNALTLGGIEPVYAFPSVVEEYGISGAIEPEEIGRLLMENPDSEAVILPSPNYYGICSDIKAIAEVVHHHGKILIVDQAHGAHLKFFSRFGGAANGIYSGRGGMPLPAEECGADIVVNSTHKTLASLTQSAVLNVCSDRVSIFDLEDKLQAIESTSPSYVLMASLDVNADLLETHGKELFDAWAEHLQSFYGRAAEIPGLKLMKVPGLMDETKINIDMSAYGINGNQLEEMLMSRSIYAELVTGNILMCMTGIGNSGEDMERLLRALAEIAESASLKKDVGEEHGRMKAGDMKTTPSSTIDKTDSLAEAPCQKGQKDPLADAARLWTKRRTLHPIPIKKQLLHIDNCCGKICASSVIPYPPGIPLICPGEEISREDIEYIKALRHAGEKVIGYSTEGQLMVGIDA